MARSKWPRIQDKLLLVEKWARDGLTEEQICKNLGISKNTMNRYKNEHSDFLNAIKKGKEIAITELENALFKKALGYEYEEVKTYIKLDDGKEVRYTEKTRKHIPPDVAACSILLKNKDHGNWSDNPMKLDLEREFLELRKKIEEVKVF